MTVEVATGSALLTESGSDCAGSPIAMVGIISVGLWHSVQVLEKSRLEVES